MTIGIPANGFEVWRRKARELVEQGVSPDAVRWRDEDAPPTLFEDAPAVEAAPGTRPSSLRVPASFLKSAEIAACHRDPERWNVFYRLLWKIVNDGSSVLSNPLDVDVAALASMRQQVASDEHRMHAYLRFRKMTAGAEERYVAWYAPDHRVLRRAAPFFVERFASMRWSILTPDESAHWDTRALTFSPGVPLSAAPSEDALEDLWRTYYGAVFNPARTNVPLLKQHVPTRYWKQMPETRAVAKLVASAGDRVSTMLETTAAAATARPYVPDSADVGELARAVNRCRGCDLYRHATQAVFGAGPADASIVLVGEQPGDQEDLQGKPFVGPAGEILSRALAEAGIDRESVYVTNAVKHFKFEPRGKRRIHQTPRLHEIRACRPWVEAEIHAIRPQVLVCLGATAAQALIGPQFRITKQRGQKMRTPWAEVTVATYHPSAVLRADDPAAADGYYRALVADLGLAAANVRQTTR